MNGKLYLHEAIAVILLNCPERTESIELIAKEISKRDLYRRKDGMHAEAWQIKLRALKRPNLFECMANGKIKLIS